jgi:hypothetical protein
MARETIPEDIEAGGPALQENDWDAIEAGEMEPTDTPANGDIRFREEKPGDLADEDDDNEYQESDEALPDDAEERAIARNPAHEGGRFDEV